MSAGAKWTSPRKLPHPNALVYADYWLWMREGTEAPLSGPGAQAQEIAACAKAFVEVQDSVLDAPDKLVAAAYRRAGETG